ncbi:Rieske 2Fe-2S domain-containing protein [Microbispora sp. NPDC049125]|uniref:cytochrome bc1 complex Rieske iron-sulfur subunit n=1 Tax=Microbispora sp. NPDC049125 TaxID=3154929 RepID=UPI0034650E87
MTQQHTDQPESRVPARVIGTPPPDEPILDTDPITTPDDVPGVVPQDPAQARRGERRASLAFLVAFLAGAAFIVSYVMFQVGTIDKTATSNYALGGTLALALFALASGITVWVRQVMPKYNMVQERHVMATTDPATREYVEKTFVAGADESGFVKHKMLRRTLLLATAPLGLAPLVLLRDLGPLPGASLRHTAWGAPTKDGKPRRLVVEGSGQPIRAADFNSPGGILSVVPEGYEENLDELAKSTLILLKFRPEELKSGTNKNWTHDGIVAYSKICTHVGCPAALYEQTTHHILCPCHQSTFDAADGAKVIFGPAARPLPQLPLGIDEEGYLVAKSDFKVPVGPSFWERGDAEAQARETAS